MPRGKLNWILFIILQITAAIAYYILKGYIK